MFVSTRKATLVELLAGPAPALASRSGSQSFLAELRLPLALASRRLVEELEAFFNRCGLGRFRVPLDHTNRLPGRQPLQIISRTNFVLVGDRLRKCQLEFTRNFGHDRSIARIWSLFNPC